MKHSDNPRNAPRDTLHGVIGKAQAEARAQQHEACCLSYLGPRDQGELYTLVVSLTSDNFTVPRLIEGIRAMNSSNFPEHRPYLIRNIHESGALHDEKLQEKEQLYKRQLSAGLRNEFESTIYQYQFLKTLEKLEKDLRHFVEHAEKKKTHPGNRAFKILTNPSSNQLQSDRELLQAINLFLEEDFSELREKSKNLLEGLRSEVNQVATDAMNPHISFDELKGRTEQIMTQFDEFHTWLKPLYERIGSIEEKHKAQLKGTPAGGTSIAGPF